MRPKKETKTWPVKWNFRSSPRICARNSNVSRSTWPWAMLKKKKSSRRDSAKLPLYYLLAIPPPPSDRYTYRWLAIFSHARWFARTRRVKSLVTKGKEEKRWEQAADNKLDRDMRGANGSRYRSYANCIGSLVRGNAIALSSSACMTSRLDERTCTSRTTLPWPSLE